MNTVVPVTNRQSALDFLLGRVNYEKIPVPYRSYGFKLDRMRRLAELLGDPQAKLPIIHIAGTKGKGSTAQMVASVLEAAGGKVGLFTSPHLEVLEERFRINGRLIPESRLVDLVARLQRAVVEQDREIEAQGARGATFFEVTTALAFLYFAEENVDTAVVEVGLGGRLDSTNICSPLVTAITSISFDHTKQLGNRLALIAGEKAGIIKPRVPIISGVADAEPRDVIRAIAREREAPLFEVHSDFEFSAEVRDGTTFASYRDAGLTLTDIPLRMSGRHQAANAATATAIVRQLAHVGREIPVAAIRTGLSAAFCPARIEFTPGPHPTIVDAAHNVASIQALLTTLDESFPARPRQLIFAVSKDKDLAAMIRRLLPQFDEIIFTQFTNSPRAAEADELHSLAERMIQEDNLPRPRLTQADTPAIAWESACKRRGEVKLTVVAGSFFLAAELGPAIRAATNPAASSAAESP